MKYWLPRETKRRFTPRSIPGRTRSIWRAATSVCGLLQAHTHDETCYDADGVLICELEERPEHIHDDSCYSMVENQYSEEPLCGMTEHVHDALCMANLLGNTVSLGGKEYPIEDFEPMSDFLISAMPDNSAM